MYCMYGIISFQLIYTIIEVLGSDFDSFFLDNGDSDWQYIFNPKTRTYCWWTKSCTTQDDDWVLTIPGGAVVQDFVHQQ